MYKTIVLRLQNFEYALGIIACVHIFIASQSALNTPACYAASAKPWTETMKDNVPHYLTAQIVSNTGRTGQKLWKIVFVPSILLSFATNPYHQNSYIYFKSYLFLCIYSVFLTFYLYWSHRSMINNQCTCH
jgi:hypothetical protein